MFEATIINGKLVPRSEAMQAYLSENEREEVIVEIKLKKKTSEKLRMYAYLNSVIYPNAIKAYERLGEFGFDDVSIDYKLKAMFAKAYRLDGSGHEEPYLLDKRSMNKKRLYKYMQDCIYFIETELEWAVPDSHLYKAKRDTGLEFERVGKQ
jgi:hypothetical protein